MRRLNGVDHMFLSLETDATTGVMGGLIRYEPTDGDQPDEAFMRARIADRLDHLPPLRWRLARVPLGLDHGYLAETQRVDLGHHVHTVRLPSPGDDAQLADEVGRLMSQPLDPTRPLWELVVVEGLADGGLVHLLKVHHGVLDGGSMPVLIDLLTDEPTHEIDPSWRRGALNEPVGGTAELWARGLVGAATRPVRAARFTATLAGWAARRLRRDAGTSVPAMVTRLLPGELATPAAAVLNRRQRRAGAPEVKPLVPTLRAPATPFNQKVTAGRICAFADLSLAELKGIGKPLGYTLNDVVVAVCAGALRRFLAEHGGVPEKPLVLCVPVGLRDPQEPFRWANDVSMIFTRMPTHLEDPLERLAYARTAVAEAKANLDEMPMEHYEQAARFMPEQFFSIPARVVTALPSRAPTPRTWNVVVSNVRGPSTPLQMAGNQVTGIWPTSFLSPVGGINITLQSYTDRVDFAIVACSDHVDELDSLVDHLRDEVALLDRVVRGEVPRIGRPTA